MFSPTQLTFLASSIFYPLAFILATPSSPSPARLAQSHEAISVFHCTLMTVLSLICLRDNSVPTLLAIPSDLPSHDLPKSKALNVDDKNLPIITKKSEFANSITALETAYLLQDSAVLFYASSLHQRVKATGLRPTKGLNIKHLAWHHASLSFALGILQWYIYQGRDKGILIIIIMMLMNASSPFGTLRWYLLNFRPRLRGALRLATLAYLSMYAVCRVYLIYYILAVFGAQKGLSALETFIKLKWHCQLGTGSMAAVNTSWLVMGVLGFVKRLGNEPLVKKRRG